MTEDLRLREKGFAFDRLHENIKARKKLTNIPERKAAYQQILDDITAELIRIGLYHLCASCRKPLNWQVAKWAYKKGIHWFCGEHYQEYENTLDIIKKHKRSFKLLASRLGAD